MSDVSEQAKALAEVMFPDGSWGPVRASGASGPSTPGGCSRDTLIAELEAQGWTPPPDPWEVIAHGQVWLFLFPGGEWLASEFEASATSSVHA